MIEETYVSFDTAKLLKEKGFDEICYACYEYYESGVSLYKGWLFEYKGEPVRNSDERIKCPTHQMVLKWLRDVHGIMISVSTYTNYDDETKQYWSDYGSHIISLSKHDLLCDVRNEADTYEEATEKAINYCLCNLIGDSLDKLIKKI